MALTERTIIDQIEITKQGHVQVRKANQVVRGEGTTNEEIVSESFWRGTIDPGDRARAEELLGPQAVIAVTAWESMGVSSS